MVDRECATIGLQTAIGLTAERGQKIVSLRIEHADAILSILKEQEAVEPTWSRGKPFCGACGLRIRGGKFCSECGKPILWEGR